jgi:hypothetical protein
MNRRVQTLLAVSMVFTIGLVFLTTNPKVLHGETDPWFEQTLDPLRFLKRFGDVTVSAGKAKKAGKVSKVGKGKRSKRTIVVSNPIPPVGPNVIFAIDTSTRMQFDADGNYYDLGTWPRADDPTVADSLGVDAAALKYRRRYDAMVERPLVLSPSCGARCRNEHRADFAVDADQITVVDDQDAGYSDFFAPTRLAIAREGLAQVIEENHRIVRFGMVRSRQGAGAVLGSPGNEEDAALVTAPQSALPGDLGNQRWKVTIPWTTTPNYSDDASGDEVQVKADISDSSSVAYNKLLLDPDEAEALLPAGMGYDDSLDSPISYLLEDAREEVVRLMTADQALYLECRNTAVVLVVGGADGTGRLMRWGQTVTGGGVTHLVPVFVIAVAPPAADVAELRAIATDSGGQYFEVSDATEVAFAANYAVQAVHKLTEDYDRGNPSIFPTTSPIVGTIDMSNANDINGVPLENSHITTASGSALTQRSNVILTAGFSLPGFEADLRAFRAYKPVLDPTQPLGYRFTKDGTPLWKARTPTTAPRNIYTYLPGTGMVEFASTAGAVSALRPYLRTSTDAEAAALIDFVRSQPLGAIVDSTPAVVDPPSLPPPDAAYANFAAARTDRRSLVFYGGNDGMLHAIDGRLGVEVWAYIPFNLLPKLSTLMDGQPVDNFTYFMDSSPKISDVKVGGTWKTMLYVGQADGGTFYQAFDVSDAGLTSIPDSDNEAGVVAGFNAATVIPFEWSFPRYSAFDHTIETGLTPFGDLGNSATVLEKSVGHTWSDPAVGQIGDSAGPYVVMTGSGFLGAEIEAQGARGNVRAGTTLYLLDAGTGAVHDSHDVGDNGGKSHFKNALQADPTATGTQGSRSVNQLFIGDTEGQLWRFDITETAGAAFLGSPLKSYDAQQHHPLFASLALINVGGPIQHLFVATGMDIVPAAMRKESFRFLGLTDDASKNAAARKEFQFNLVRQNGAGGDERPTPSPAVAADVVFYTTTTEFPDDPCRCFESALYALNYDGNSAYGAGTGGTKVKKGKTKGKNTTQSITVWEGRSTAPFVADQHLYFNVGDELRVLGDLDDYNNGVTSEGVRVTSWREIRR